MPRATRLSPVQRLEVIRQIASHLQATYTFAEIDIVLEGYEIDPPDGSFDSKRSYAMECLKGVGDNVLFQISSDLNLMQPLAELVSTEPPAFWREEGFRLFLSHLSSAKESAHRLAEELLSIGIRAFVAHDSIQPTREWQNEIEKALSTMDALAAIFSPGFKESPWCDQEVGWALGRGVLVVPLRGGVGPHGFVGKFQAVPAFKRQVSDITVDLVEALALRPQTSRRLAETSIGPLSELARNFKGPMQRSRLIRYLCVVGLAWSRNEFETFGDAAKRRGRFSFTSDEIDLLESKLEQNPAAKQFLADIREDEIPF